MTNWAKYFKERFGRETIEADWGFISYSINPPNCVIEDMYVVPEKRGVSVGHGIVRMLEREAKELGCTRLWAQVWDNDRGATNTLGAALQVGFKVQSAEGNRIIIGKEIGG